MRKRTQFLLILAPLLALWLVVVAWNYISLEASGGTGNGIVQFWACPENEEIAANVDGLSERFPLIAQILESLSGDERVTRPMKGEVAAFVESQNPRVLRHAGNVYCYARIVD